VRGDEEFDHLLFIFTRNFQILALKKDGDPDPWDQMITDLGGPGTLVLNPFYLYWSRWCQNRQLKQIYVPSAGSWCLCGDGFSPLTENKKCVIIESLNFILFLTCSHHLSAHGLLLVHHDFQRRDQSDIPRKILHFSIF